jgi:hypothetical protein
VVAEHSRIRCEDVIRAELSRPGELLVAHVEGDDTRRGYRAEDLHGEVAETADADDHGGRIGSQRGQGLLDGVVGRESRVGERRGVHGIKVAERHEQPGVGHQHELGHAAITAQAAAA